MLKQSHVFLPFFYNFCQHSLIYLFLLGLVTGLTFWLSVSLGVQEQDLWHAQIIIGSSLSLRWYMYQIGRNSGIVSSFLNYFFTVFFYVFCRKRSVQCISVIEKQITRRGWNRWYVQSQYHSIFFHNQTFLRNSSRIFYQINRVCASKHSY